MSKQANYKLIGAFVVGAVALLVGAIVLLGGGELFQDDINAVMFFNESVKGLAIGAPVSYHGVPVGSVKSVSLLVSPKDDQMYLPVQIEFPKGRAEVIGHDEHGGLSHDQRLDFFKRAISRGLKGQLTVDSMVTGQLYIQLDMFPEMPTKLFGLEKGELEIPTVPSGLQQLMGRIKQIPIDEIARRLSNTLENIDKLVSSPDAAEAVVSLNALLKSGNKLTQNVDNAILPLVNDVQRNLNNVSSDATQTLQQANKAAASIDALVAKNSPFYYRLNITLDEISAAARSLHVFADYLERHPEALLRGKNESGGK